MVPARPRERRGPAAGHLEEEEEQEEEEQDHDDHGGDDDDETEHLLILLEIEAQAPEVEPSSS